MIGVDTNILLRAFADDDEQQGAQARELLARLEADGGTVWVNTVVLCEFVWTLRGTKRLSRAELADLVELLLSTELLQFAERDCVERALATFRTSRADFADALIGALNRRTGCATTYTLDGRAAGTADFVAVG